MDKPLVEFCRAPRRAPDLLEKLGEVAEGQRDRFAAPGRSGMIENLDLAQAYFRAGGLREVARRGWGRVRRVLAERATSRRRAR